MRIDPYTQQIPQKLTNKDGTPTPEFLQWLIYDNRFKHDLWQGITDGSGEYDIETSVGTNADGLAAQNFALISELLSRMNALESNANLSLSTQKRRNPITVTSNYSAAAWDDITAKNNAKVTLPATLAYNDIITVRNGDGSAITISGGGTKIRRQSLLSEIKSVRLGTTLDFKYKADTNEYVL